MCNKFTLSLLFSGIHAMQSLENTSINMPQVLSVNPEDVQSAIMPLTRENTDIDAEDAGALSSRRITPREIMRATMPDVDDASPVIKSIYCTFLFIVYFFFWQS